MLSLTKTGLEIILAYILSLETHIFGLEDCLPVRLRKLEREICVYYGNTMVLQICDFEIFQRLPKTVRVERGHWSFFFPGILGIPFDSLSMTVT